MRQTARNSQLKHWATTSMWVTLDIMSCVSTSTACARQMGQPPTPNPPAAPTGTAHGRSARSQHGHSTMVTARLQSQHGHSAVMATAHGHSTPPQHGHGHSTVTATARSQSQHGHSHSTVTVTARSRSQHGHSHSTVTAWPQHSHGHSDQRPTHRLLHVLGSPDIVVVLSPADPTSFGHLVVWQNIGSQEFRTNQGPINHVLPSTILASLVLMVKQAWLMVTAA